MTAPLRHAEVPLIDVAKPVDLSQHDRALEAYLPAL